MPTSDRIKKDKDRARKTERRTGTELNLTLN